MPFYLFFGEGSTTKIDYRRKGTLILSSLLEDLGVHLPRTCYARRVPRTGTRATSSSLPTTIGYDTVEEALKLSPH